jgi:hypothetical protein
LDVPFSQDHNPDSLVVEAEKIMQEEGKRGFSVDLPVTGGEVKKITQVLSKYGPVICSMVSLVKDDKRTLLFRVKPQQGNVCSDIRRELLQQGYRLELY